MIEYIQKNLRYKDGCLYRTTNRGGEKVGTKAGWQAAVMVNGKHISLGSHVTKEEAYEAYKAGAQKHFREFARPEARTEHRMTM